MLKCGWNQIRIRGAKMKRRVKRHAVVQPLDESYRLIPLTQGQNAIVDAADFEWLSQWNWYAAWSKFTHSFYARRQTADNRTVRMHRIILRCKRSDEEGDHKNHNTLDNRRNNLRKCTHPQNGRNAQKSRCNTSGYKGVTWDKDWGKWVASIVVNRRRHHLGGFDDRARAARAYKNAALRFHAAFAHW